MTKHLLMVLVLLVAQLVGGCGDDVGTKAPEASCTNGIDDDDNGKTDCADPACASEAACTLPATKALTTFAFLDAPNPALSADVTATINGLAISATLPAGTNVTALVATFATTGMHVSIGGVVQESGVTAHDFTTPATYVVTAANGTTEVYTVTVNVAPTSSKDLTAFAFLDASNPALSADVTATINGTSIAATVPTGTDVGALVATFSTTGATVRVGSTPQVSGTTANNFTTPVQYDVTAGDGSTKTYTVVVTVAAGTAKDLTAFSFLTTNNAGLPANVTATINGTAITATVPTGTNVSALVATFTTTGVGVTVGGTTQVSGTTANNFGSAVTYVVTAGDATTKTYTVTVTVAPSSAKDITAFAIPGATSVTINGLAIAVTVPTGTDVTALVATFSTTGASVKVGGVTQVSGVTANNFTNPVMYTVTAADASTQIYTVTVTVAASSAKDITAFSIPGATSVTINGLAIAVTVPTGTDVTALVATFSTTGASVKVGGTIQASGVTPNNFTSPVMYVVTAADTTTRTYTVTITVAASAAKDLTAFAFTDAANTALSADVTATINGTAIAATVPNGTNVTALVATFSTTGASVTVGGTTQISGTTPNNFTSPVTYTVTAADTTTKIYTVTITVAAAATVPNGTYTWNTWICTRGATVIDIKAFAQSLGITDVHTTYTGGTGLVEVFRTASCVRTSALTSVSYPAAMQIQTIADSMFTCSAGCTPQQCTAGSQTVITDLFNFTTNAGGYTFNRTFPAGGVTLQSVAGCMTGDIESGTNTLL